ncbi:MAG: hypothetical protein C5B50_09105 [Verrucomicrobia bacterium]|nr:MAG: hypothetical protein C5B50_09105 [Verrucomicrobiota bacterium]
MRLELGVWIFFGVWCLVFGVSTERGIWCLVFRKMASFQEYKRRSLVPLAGMGLAAYYLLVFLPIERRAEGLDAPLRQARKQLSMSMHQTNGGFDFARLTNQLAETRCALDQLDNARQKVATRLEPGAVVRARMSSPFHYVEYENERSKLMESLGKMAKQQGVSLEPEVFAGFPEYTADMEQPSFLWAALALADNFVTCALQAKVSALHWLETPVALTNNPANEPPGHWTEIPLQVEFTASALNATRLIQSLPLRSDEIRAAGLPEAPPDKLPLFIERLVIRKQSPDKPDEVRVWLRLVGFVSRE